MFWIATTSALGIGIFIGFIIGVLFSERNISFLASQALVDFNARLQELHWCSHEEVEDVP